jgi:hypothetical protein
VTWCYSVQTASGGERPEKLCPLCAQQMAAKIESLSGKVAGQEIQNTIFSDFLHKNILEKN